MTLTEQIRSDLQLLTADDLCDLLQVDRSWVYRHASELGGFKVGKYLRFHEAKVKAWVGN